MFQSVKFRAAVTLLVCLAAIIFLLPSLTEDLPDSWKKILPKDKIHLGLDLQGGMHLALEVDTEKAVEATLERAGNDLKDKLMESKVRFRNLERKQGNVLSVEIPDSESRNGLEKTLKEFYPDLEIASSETTGGKETAILKYKAKRVSEIKKQAVEQSLETIRNRVDEFGVSEPEIIPEGNDRIIVQLPGITDVARAKNLIGKMAHLEFKLVDDEHSLEDALRGNVPEGDIIAYGYESSGNNVRREGKPYLLKSKALLTGESLETAQVKIADRMGEPYVSIKFKPEGAADFERITSENVKKRLAIVLDGTVRSAPEIREKIAGGQAQITGSFTMDEAKDLAIVLRAGALPAPVNILEERTVGPSLGQDSIKKGIWSTIIGAILVIVFMVLYYKWSGLVANAALVLNLIIILGIMAAFRATLTVPGIAGIVLTIGMAVDANVLIF